MPDDSVYYLTMVDLSDYLPINTGWSSATESTMITALGSPEMPLTTDDQPERASPEVKKLEVTQTVSKHIRVTGIKPAVDSLQIVLNAAFSQESALGHDLNNVLGTAGMLNVRLRKPASGKPSTAISNHAWGTAIDFEIIGHEPPESTGGKIPRFIGVLLASFHKEGWFSGIDFQDDMHFEVAEETIKEWKSQGKLG